MAVKVGDIVNLIDRFAPPYLAAEWDRVGLQVGDPDAEIEKVLVTLDVTPEVIEEAHSKGAGLILSHHPIIRGDIPSPYLTSSDPSGKCLLRAAQMNISIFVAHTNLDKTLGGVSDVLAEALELKNVEVLFPEEEKDSYKLVVFVPEKDVDRLITAMSEAGAGVIGKYTYCSFRTSGLGTFRPEESAQPAIGERLKINEVAEHRLEMLVPSDRLNAVLKAMLEAHPYEEVAYDLFQRQNPSLGFGRIGDLEEDVSLEKFLLLCRKKLKPVGLRVVGNTEAKVRRVAVCGGGGADLIPQAKAKGADVYLTGDIKYHQAQLAKFLEIMLIDAGHNSTEKVIVPQLVSLIKESNLKVLAEESKVETSPWVRVINLG